MLFPNKNRQEIKDLEELVFLRNQVQEVRLQDKLGEQNFHHDSEKTFEPMTDVIKKTSQDITKTITETSIKNNKTLENLNTKLLEVMNDRGIKASYLTSPLSKITIPENSSQFKLVKKFNSNRVFGLKIHNSKPITLHDNLLTFRDTGKVFE